MNETKLPWRERLQIIREVWAILQLPSGYVKYGTNSELINMHCKHRWGKYERKF